MKILNQQMTKRTFVKKHILSNHQGCVLKIERSFHTVLVLLLITKQNQRKWRESIQLVKKNKIYTDIQIPSDYEYL